MQASSYYTSTIRLSMQNIFYSEEKTHWKDWLWPNYEKKPLLLQYKENYIERKYETTEIIIGAIEQSSCD